MDVLSSRQISEWEAYDKIDPIGTWREDFRTAELVSLIVNIVSKLYAKEGHTPKETTPLDFMPDWLGEKEKQGQSVDQMKEILMGFAKEQNKKVVRETRKHKPPKRHGLKSGKVSNKDDG